jgi:hypothetical protein
MTANPFPELRELAAPTPDVGIPTSAPNDAAPPPRVTFPGLPF